MYLVMGMTADEYWNGDPQLVKSYREAEKIRKDRMNEQNWLMGMYVYDAMCRVAPILHVFAPGGTKAHPYPEQPYALTVREQEDREEAKKRKAMEEAKRYMEQFAARYRESGGD